MEAPPASAGTVIAAMALLYTISQSGVAWLSESIAGDTSQNHRLAVVESKVTGLEESVKGVATTADETKIKVEGIKAKVDMTYDLLSEEYRKRE